MTAVPFQGTAPAVTSPVPPPGYGGHRLEPSHYEPDRVPQAVAQYAGVPDTLPSGSPGKVGLLELEFARTTHGTELVEHYQKSPLQIMHPLYFDPARPDMPYTYLMSTGAGIMQGDRLRTDLAFGTDTSAHVTTSAYTKVLRMQHDYAVAQTNIAVGADAYVEFLPDPWVVFADARLYQRTCLTLAPSATAIVGETLIGGRLAHDEHHDYTVLASDFEVSRPDGAVVALDRLRLTPAEGACSALAVLGDRAVVSTLYVLTPRVPVAEISELLHDVLAPSAGAGVIFGVSTLPGESGAWVRLLSDDAQEVGRAVTLAWQGLRRLLTGADAPKIRKT